MNTTEMMQRRFHELRQQRQALIDQLKPLQDKYDALRRQQNEIDAALEPIKAELKARKAPLFAINNECGVIARALNGQTGKP